MILPATVGLARTYVTNINTFRKGGCIELVNCIDARYTYLCNNTAEEWLQPLDQVMAERVQHTISMVDQEERC